MAELDAEEKRLTLKLVYYGPALSGKTTNLTRLHDFLKPELKGEMMMMETKNDRTLFFDLLPLGIRTPTGLLVRVKIFTVPGQVSHDSTRKAVLSRADGVVFAADSQQTQSINNAESFDNLADNAARVGLDFSCLPLVVQFNKRDLADIVSEEEVLQRWSQTTWPICFASALKGDGVVETFRALLERVYDSINKDENIREQLALQKNDFIDGLLGVNHE